MSATRRELFEPSAEADARILLLIKAFSTGSDALEGRVKLAKLDFFLRYPAFLARALRIRSSSASARDAALQAEKEGATIETRMIRYRYGPWDPAYFGILGRLVGSGLVEPVPLPRGFGYRTTQKGKAVATQIESDPAWTDTASRIVLIKRHLNLTGASLMRFVYNNFPEVQTARVGSTL